MKTQLWIPGGKVGIPIPLGLGGASLVSNDSVMKTWLLKAAKTKMVPHYFRSEWKSDGETKITDHKP